ncbi:mobilization protein MobC [Mucilaginibacter gracilis]|uniref:Mobilization protein MobC n=2 Tax=Mucilaginibacter gracilis TaxID=423350 RepID=A0A495IZP9_9SPHI|nr:mobilization protein MobC [Mucilaginibacter gracilis]
MKRTRKNGGEKRDLFFRFRVNADEKLTYQQQAKNNGLSVSDYMRKRLEGQDELLDRRDYLRLLAELSKQGSNLNQYAKAMNIWVNIGNDPQIEPGMIRHCITEITRLSRELMEIIKHANRRKTTR